jgi:hypothetical protein
VVIKFHFPTIDTASLQRPRTDNSDNMADVLKETPLKAVQVEALVGEAGPDLAGTEC